MRYLRPILAGVAVMVCSSPAVAEEGGVISAPFVARTEVFEGDTQSFRPDSPDDVVVAMRIEGATINDLRSDARPYVEFDGQKVTGPVKTSGKSTQFQDGEAVRTFEPYLFLLFSVPEKAKTLTLVVANHPPLLVSLPDEVSAQLDSWDVR
jgi:hypothetical protein